MTHVYDLTTLADCVRIVLDARPSKGKQEAMLEVIRRMPNTPSRADILNALKEKNK